MMEMKMKQEREEGGSWKERVTMWSLALFWGFMFYLIARVMFWTLGLIHHGVSLLFGWPTKY